MHHFIHAALVRVLCPAGFRLQLLGAIMYVIELWGRSTFVLWSCSLSPATALSALRARYWSFACSHCINLCHANCMTSVTSVSSLSCPRLPPPPSALCPLLMLRSLTIRTMHPHTHTHWYRHFSHITRMLPAARLNTSDSSRLLCLFD